MARTEHFIHSVLELQEARFDFALDCLHHANNIRSGNIAFSPYSLYEGLTMIYFASSDGDTDTRLKYVLKLPDDILKSFWVTYNIAERMKENREDSNGFYNQNICWINKAKQIKDITSNFFNSNKFTELDFNVQTNLMHRINEILQNELQNYVPKPIKFNNFNESMEFILSSVLCFRNDTFQQQHEFLTNMPESYFQRQPRTVVSCELNMVLTELPFINKTQSFITLFSAVQDSETWLINENIDELIKD
ncbi:uncharacterized protein LOC114930280 [Nylanderia fulva]|uniref:uncharacterized protein LOC114930280 n=1 Tax=Nylanderia fulva TaxID=613905 RepID=UPI0010FB5361|nr:uncharacterized protein LOC114930280 [Nylanderia fulva]